MKLPTSVRRVLERVGMRFEDEDDDERGGGDDRSLWINPHADAAEARCREVDQQIAQMKARYLALGKDPSFEAAQERAHLHPVLAALTQDAATLTAQAHAERRIEHAVNKLLPLCLKLQNTAMRQMEAMAAMADAPDIETFQKFLTVNLHVSVLRGLLYEVTGRPDLAARRRDALGLLTHAWTTVHEDRQRLLHSGPGRRKALMGTPSWLPEVHQLRELRVRTSAARARAAQPTPLIAPQPTAIRAIGAAS